MTPLGSSLSELELGGFFRFVAEPAGETCNEIERDFVDRGCGRLLKEALSESVCRVR